MTIDEAIQIEKYFGKKDKKALEELQKEFPMIHGITDNNLHENIVEWLEELKAIKTDGFTDHLLNMGYTKGYRKAIDEFAEKLKANSELGYIGYLNRVVDEIAEQLKGGAE